MSFLVQCVNSEFRFQDLLSGGGRCKSSSSVSTHRMAIIFCFLLTTKWVIKKLRGHYEVGSRCSMKHLFLFTFRAENVLSEL